VSESVQAGASPPPEGAPRFVSNADKLGFVPPLDGMRGLGVMLVILVHIVFEPFASFAIVVDMFFVISGFLITTLLLEEDRRAGRVDLRRFYTRRALRLLPLLFLVLAFTLVGALVVHLLFDNRELLDKAISDVIAGGAYVYHVVHPVHIELVGGGPAEIRPLLQLWSLSVEEHFYVFGVLIVLFVVKRRWVTALMVTFLGAYVFIAVARAMGHVGPRFAWYQRPDALMLGVVLAFANARMTATWSERTVVWMKRATTVATVVLLAVIFVGSWFARPFGLYVPFLTPEGTSVDEGLYWGRFGFTIASTCFAIMIITFVRCPDHPVARFLSWKWFGFVGVRSYGIYLIHVPLGVLMLETIGKVAPAVGLVLYLPLLALLTELAHRFIEKPAMRLKVRLAEPGASGARVD
jgi:peptidoglycan/LPS O-acetylase OafA/YrhL